MFLQSRTSAGEYANKYMDNLVYNQTLINETMSFNPVPENMKKGKTLYPYLRELLAEQDKYICLNQDKILSNLKNYFCVWTPHKKLDEKLTPFLKCQNSSIKLFCFLYRLLICVLTLGVLMS